MKWRTFSRDIADLAEALGTQLHDHLLAGQSNDPYWHGLFGGIYLPDLRVANLSRLIAAEDIALAGRPSESGVLRDVDLASRWGGEEFVLVLPGTDGDGGARLAERVRDQLRARTILALDGTPIEVTASFGVATSLGGASAQELLARADAALYEAKRAGKDRVERAVEALVRP